MNDVLTKAEFQKAMRNHEQFLTEKLEPVIVDVAVAKTDIVNLKKLVEENRKHNRNWDVFNTLGAIVAGIFGGIFGQK